MKVPVTWLNEYVDVSDLSVRELSDKLTFSGIEVEGIEQVGATLDDKFVVGEVTACAPHANSDHLSVCEVSDGTATFQVVCGAPNARAGLKVAFARVGAVIPEGGFTIKKARLRGVDSFGMLCSARELKISDEHAGIMELDDDAVPGTPLGELLPPPESVFDLEVTWNRPDCLSIIGVARELAALLKRPLRLPAVEFEESDEPVESFAKVIVEDTQKCPRYTARVMTGVRDGPAPDWMRRRLELCGLRPISLSVDTTNYVMLECGQPLHAFDYRQLAERTIRVRRATAGEKLRTLDGIERQLDEDMLVIADAHNPSAVAGVMGGALSEIVHGTEHILLESALFEAASTKRTSTKLGLASESSRRFERGVDPELADWASRRATALLCRFGQARVARGVLDVDNRQPRDSKVALCFKNTSEVIGVALAAETIIETLTSLGLEVDRRDAESATFRIPSHRLDLAIEADLIEEVARMRGLDSIPDRLPAGAAVSLLDDTPFHARARCRQLLLGMGFSEAMHYSFLGGHELDAFDKRHADQRCPLPNPVSADYGVLRDSLLPQLATSLGRNAARQVECAALFEIGRVFFKTGSGAPCEEERVALGMMGPFMRSPIDRRRPVGREEAMLALKGVTEQLAAALGAAALDFAPCEHPSFEKGWALEISLDGAPLGSLGLLSGAWRHKWRMISHMPLAEMRLEPLLATGRAARSVTPVPLYPSVSRDVAFVADATVTHRMVAETIRKAAPAELTRVEIFDIFESKEIGKGKRSLAYSLEFRSPERTLTDQEVNTAFTRIVKALKNTLGVEVREGNLT